MIEPYSWQGGQEQMLRIGANCSIQIIIIQPLFEENNRLRQIIVTLMRALEREGVGSALPDLPGMGESLAEPGWDAWRSAAQAAAEAIRPSADMLCVVAARGGALIDDAIAADRYWRLSPETGARIVRDLERTRLGASAASDLYAGHRLDRGFLDTLGGHAPAPLQSLRTARLAEDAGDADVRFDAAPPWRRAEPGADPSLAAAMAADILAWLRP